MAFDVAPSPEDHVPSLQFTHSVAADKAATLLHVPALQFRQVRADVAPETVDHVPLLQLLQMSKDVDDDIDDLKMHD